MSEESKFVKMDRIRELEDAKALLFKLESYAISHEESCCFEESDKAKCDCGLSATLRDIYSLGLQESLDDERKGTYLAVSITLTDENKSLREQLKFAQAELTATKVVVEAAERWHTASLWDGTGSIEDAAVNIGVAAACLGEALKDYGSKFPGEEEK